ncbi:MAG: hypothetical protein LBM19_04175 [Holosporales bacterium]|jgi:NADH:ubiquinone oxidoreductase subunit 3 (subunit A)|nr:hypothetical protein [Holosporales bacterium]
MLSFVELSTASITILLGGAISVSALLVSKISLLLPFKDDSRDASSYECGFQNNEPDFIYLSDKSDFAPLYLVVELATVLLLFCCSIGITRYSYAGNIFLKVLATIILEFMISVKKIIAKKDNL